MATNGVPKRKYSPDNVDPSVIHVNLSIRFQDGGHKLHFKVNQDTELSIVFKDFCERTNLEYETIKFIYDGTRLNGKKTPKMLEMENGTELMAVRDQLGGGTEEDNMDSFLKYYY